MTTAASEPIGNEFKRISERLFHYWDDLRRDRAYPTEGDIDYREISDIWDSCFLVRVSEDVRARGYKYSYLGTSIIEAFGDDLTGQEVYAKLVDTANDDIVHRFEEMVERAEPLIDESEFINRRKMLVKYRYCMLPLGREKGKVDYIIGGMKWKAY